MGNVQHNDTIRESQHECKLGTRVKHRISPDPNQKPGSIKCKGNVGKKPTGRTRSSCKGSDLFYVLIGGTNLSYINPDGHSEAVPDQIVHFSWHGGCEQQCLPIWSNLTHQTPDLHLAFC